MVELFMFQGQFTLGQKVRVCRVAKRLRQIDLAHQVGVAQTEVSRLERGQNVCPSAERKILGVLGLICDGVEHYEQLIKRYQDIPGVRRYFEKRLAYLKNGERQSVL